MSGHPERGSLARPPPTEPGPDVDDERDEEHSRSQSLIDDDMDPDQISHEQAMELLRKLRVANDLFTCFDDDQLHELADMLSVLNCLKGDAIMAKGEDATFCAVILDGTCSVKVSDTFSVELKAGKVLGEMAYFEGGLRSADIFVSSEKATLAAISYKQLRNILRDSPSTTMSRFIELLALASLMKLRSQIAKQSGATSTGASSTSAKSGGGGEQKTEAPSYAGKKKELMNVPARHRHRRKQSIYAMRLEQQETRSERRIKTEINKREKLSSKLGDLESRLRKINDDKGQMRMLVREKEKEISRLKHQIKMSKSKDQRNLQQLEAGLHRLRGDLCDKCRRLKTNLSIQLSGTFSRTLTSKRPKPKPKVAAPVSLEEDKRTIAELDRKNVTLTAKVRGLEAEMQELKVRLLQAQQVTVTEATLNNALSAQASWKRKCASLEEKLLECRHRYREVSGKLEAVEVERGKLMLWRTTASDRWEGEKAFYERHRQKLEVENAEARLDANRYRTILVYVVISQYVQKFRLRRSLARLLTKITECVVVVEEEDLLEGNDSDLTLDQYLRMKRDSLPMSTHRSTQSGGKEGRGGKRWVRSQAHDFLKKVGVQASNVAVAMKDAEQLVRTQRLLLSKELQVIENEHNSERRAARGEVGEESKEVVVAPAPSQRHSADTQAAKNRDPEHAFRQRVADTVRNWYAFDPLCRAEDKFMSGHDSGDDAMESKQEGGLVPSDAAPVLPTSVAVTPAAPLNTQMTSDHQPESSVFPPEDDSPRRYRGRRSRRHKRSQSLLEEDMSTLTLTPGLVAEDSIGKTQPLSPVRVQSPASPRVEDDPAKVLRLQVTTPRASSAYRFQAGAHTPRALYHRPSDSVGIMRSTLRKHSRAPSDSSSLSVWHARGHMAADEHGNPLTPREKQKRRSQHVRTVHTKVVDRLKTLLQTKQQRFLAALRMCGVLRTKPGEKLSAPVPGVPSWKRNSLRYKASTYSVEVLIEAISDQVAKFAELSVSIKHAVSRWRSVSQKFWQRNVRLVEEKLMLHTSLQDAAQRIKTMEQDLTEQEDKQVKQLEAQDASVRASLTRRHAREISSVQDSLSALEQENQMLRQQFRALRWGISGHELLGMVTRGSLVNANEASQKQSMPSTLVAAGDRDVVLLDGDQVTHPESSSPQPVNPSPPAPTTRPAYSSAAAQVAHFLNAEGSGPHSTAVLIAKKRGILQARAHQRQLERAQKESERAEAAERERTEIRWSDQAYGIQRGWKDDDYGGWDAHRTQPSVSADTSAAAGSAGSSETRRRSVNWNSVLGRSAWGPPTRPRRRRRVPAIAFRSEADRRRARGAPKSARQRSAPRQPPRGPAGAAAGQSAVRPKTARRPARRDMYTRTTRPTTAAPVRLKQRQPLQAEPRVERPERPTTAAPVRLKQRQPLQSELREERAERPSTSSVRTQPTTRPSTGSRRPVGQPGVSMRPATAGGARAL